MAQTGIQEGLLVGRRRRRGVPPWIQGTLVALLVALAFSAITGTVYWFARQALIHEIHSGLLRTSAVALRSIDPAAHAQLTRPEDRDTPAYDQQAEPLRDIIAADPQVTFVGTAIERDGKVYFILDGTPRPGPGEEWPDTAVGVMEQYDDPPPEMLAVLRNGQPTVSEPYSDEWGSYISAFQPIKDAAGATVGVLYIDLSIANYEKRLLPVQRGSLAAGAIGILIAVLMGIGVWFNRKTDRTARELARQLRTVNALLAVSRALGSGVNLGDLLPVIIKQTKAVMAAEHSVLFLVEPSGRLRRHTAAGSEETTIAPSGLIGRVAESRRTLSVLDARAEPDFDPAIDQCDGAPTRSMLAQPITDARGQLVGLMQVTNKIGEPGFDEDDQILLGALGSQVMAALDRARLTQVYVEKQKLDEALKLAASIQMSMLSRSFPPPGSGAVEVHACLVPAKEVGGDFYDFFWIDPTTLAFLVADVSGKGMPAALFMAKAKTLVKAHASLVREPEQILARANDELSEDNDNGMFVTLFLGVLDTDSGLVRAANAGHNLPYLVPAAADKPVERLKTSEDIALGVMDGMPYAVTEFQLAPGDTLFLYTDGINEAMDRNDEQFDYPRMEAVLAERHTSIVELDDAMLASVREFTTGAEPSDDLTILTVRWRGG